MKSKIALTTYAMYVGGLEVFILALAQALVRAGHETHVVATEEPGKWFPRVAEVGAVADFIDGMNHRSRAEHARRVGAFLRDSGFDVVINNNSWFVQASLGMLPDQVTAISVIHNNLPIVLSLACANERASNAVVAPSQATFEGAAPLLHDRAKLHLIAHGIVVPDSPPERPARHELAVLFSGRLFDPQKNVLLLPAIMKRAAECGAQVQLDIIGDGPDRERLAQKIAQSGLETIRMRGELAHEAALESLRRADVMMMPSSYEGLPFILLEAMATGCIPVVSRLPGVTDWVVEHGRTGFLASPGDVEEFSEQLVRLARDAELRARVRRAAWESVRDRFRLERMAEDYLSLIDSLQQQSISRKRLPKLAPELILWRDRLPNPWRKPLGRLWRAALGAPLGSPP